MNERQPGLCGLRAVSPWARCLPSLRSILLLGSHRWDFSQAGDAGGRPFPALGGRARACLQEVIVITWLSY